MKFTSEKLTSVLNINGYIGESAANEIAYAEKVGRPISYWQALSSDKEKKVINETGD